MILVVIKGFIYTIALNIYALHLAFSSILHCVLHHFALRFVPFYLPSLCQTQIFYESIDQVLMAKNTIFTNILIKNMRVLYHF